VTDDFDEPVLIDDRDGLVGRGEPRPVGHVLRRAVVVESGHDKVLRRALFEDRERRRDLDALDRGISVRRGLAAAGDPLGEDAILPRPGVEPLPAFVRRGHGRLRDEETLRRVPQFDATTARLAGDRIKVRRGIVGKQAETESALAGNGTVTGTRVAPLPRQHGHDVSAEAPLEVLVVARHDDLAGRDLVTALSRDRGDAVASRVEDAVDDLGDPGFVRHQRCRGHATDEHALVAPLHEDVLNRFAAVQSNRPGQDRDFRLRHGAHRQNGDGEAV